MTKIYSSILDQILDDLTVDPGEVGLKTEASRGDAFASITDKEDDGLLSELAPGDHRQATPFGSVGVTAADWRKRSQEAILGDGLLSETMANLQGKQGSDVEKRTLTASQVEKFISDQLHLGFTPERVAAKLDKLAENYMFEKGMSTQFLDDMSGVMGYAFLNPNQFNDSCQASLDRIKKEGSLHALSVKKIAACSGCRSCVGGSCSLYKLPIVASSRDLQEILAERASRSGKKASKNVLVALHNRKDLSEKTSAPSAHAVGKIGGFSTPRKPDVETLTPEHIASRVGAQSLEQVYSSLVPTYGKVATKVAVGKYLKGVGKTASKIVLANVDCRYLAGKLTPSNAIVGSSKCASCAMRSAGMHCGLTGGTLLSFPGMDTVKTGKIAHQGSIDGKQALAEYELDSHEPMINASGDIELSEYQYEDVDPQGSLDLE